MQKLIKPLIQRNNSRIVFVVLDGLGGLPLNGRTEIETAVNILPLALANAGRLKKFGA